MSALGYAEIDSTGTRELLGTWDCREEWHGHRPDRYEWFKENVAEAKMDIDFTYRIEFYRQHSEDLKNTEFRAVLYRYDKNAEGGRYGTYIDGRFTVARRSPIEVGLKSEPPKELR